MPKIVWDDIGKRLYETGVSHGVLYPRTPLGLYPLGVSWNGLTGVTENPTGAEQTKLYADNINYVTMMSREEFGATVEAYTYPDEFAACDGSAALSTGVYIGQQPRQSFGMAYRTILGNDTALDEFGYKLHLIYGATASPSDKAYATVNESPEAITFSWEITCTPVNVAGKKPTASLVIDSTKVAPAKLAILEDILYGTPGADPRLPLPDEVAALFEGAPPSALQLVSSVPLDDATGVLRTAPLVLTFNNKIVSFSFVLTTTAGVLVPGTGTWNAAGTIYTFVPTTTLAPTTAYLYTISALSDVFGQTMTSVVRTFTTAS